MKITSRKPKSKRKNIFSIALVLSFIVHGLFLFQRIITSKSFDHKKITKNRDSKTLKFVFKRNLSEEKKQIVNSESGGRNEIDPGVKFLGEKNQVFDRQTIARKTDSFKQAGRGATLKEKVVKKSSPVLNFKDLGFSAPGLFAKNIKSHFDAEKFRRKNQEESLIQPGVSHGDPSTTGAAANNDYIQDVALGDATRLNTQEFKYYGFYFRIRQRLEQYWGNTLKEKVAKMYRAGRSVASESDKITALVVHLDEKGKIIQVTVKDSSGVNELDEAAIESFNKAGPFPNPPKGMLDSNGRIKIEWGFVVKS